jgi:hypothetical protein
MIVRILLILIVSGASEILAQPLGGTIILNITYEGKEIIWKYNHTPNKPSTLNSEPRGFILKDLSPHMYNQIYSFKDSSYYPRKKLFVKNDYHLQVINKKSKEVMDVYIYNIPPQNYYYLELPFKKGNYVLTILPTKDVVKPIIIDKIYPKKHKDSKHSGVDITPLDWKNHLLNDVHLLTNLNLNDFLVRKEPEKKIVKLPNRAIYEGLSQNWQTKLIVDGEDAILSSFLSRDFIEMYYREMYGKIKYLHDSIYTFEIDSALWIFAHMSDELLEGREPATIFIDESTISCNNSLTSILSDVLIVDYDTIPNIIDTVNFLKLPHNDYGSFTQYFIYNDIVKWQEKSATQRLFLLLNCVNMITSERLKLPLNPMFTFFINETKGMNRNITLNKNTIYIHEDRIMLKRNIPKIE